MDNKAKRIGTNVLDSELLNLINSSAKIFPITLSDLQNNFNPLQYEYCKYFDPNDNVSYIYNWQGGAWVKIGAEDKSVDWINDVKNKPTSFPNDQAHTHTSLTLLESITQSLLDKWNSAFDHISDLVKHVTGAERTLWNTVSNKADVTHDHDGRYNTKSEITSALLGKSDTTHNHDTSYASKSIESTVSSHTTELADHETRITSNATQITTLSNNMANGDMHSNITILNSLTQPLLDSWNSAVSHISDLVKHITSAERTTWNNKAEVSQIPTNNNQLTNGAGYLLPADITSKTDKTYVDTQLALKVDSTTLTGHTGNSTIHVTQTDKDNWNGKAQITQGTVQPSSGYWFKEV